MGVHILLPSLCCVIFTVIEKTLCQADLVEMNESMTYMTELEQLVTKEKMSMCPYVFLN